MCSLVGLVVGTVVGLLTYWYPPRFGLYTPKGEPIQGITTTAQPENVRRGRFQAVVPRVMPLGLAAGFLLQVPTAIAALQWCP